MMCQSVSETPQVDKAMYRIATVTNEQDQLLYEQLIIIVNVK